MATKDYPYSSLFDYAQIEREEEERKQRQQSVQQKILRTNALGDALRLLVDVAGGSRGATITPKPINPGIMKASDRLKAIEDQHRADMQRWKMQDLAMKTRDMDYNLGREAEGRNKIWEAQKIADQRAWEDERFGKTLTHQEKMAEINAAKAKELETLRSKNDLTQIQEKYKGEVEKVMVRNKGDVEKAGGFYAARYDNPYETEALNRDVVIGMFKDLKQHLADKGIYMQPKVLQAENKGKISNDDLRTLISDYPEFFAPRLPQLTGGQALPQKPELSPIEKRREKYDKELEEIMLDMKKSYKQRMREIKRLNKDNEDIINMTNPPIVKEPAELVNQIYSDAQSIYNKGTSAEQVAEDLKALVNTKFPDTDPSTKANIYNSLIERF